MMWLPGCQVKIYQHGDDAVTKVVSQHLPTWDDAVTKVLIKKYHLGDDVVNRVSSGKLL
jgi:hypothetical protein